jgi:hypothetical protein
VGLLENHISYSRSKDFPITRSSDQPISRFTRFPDHPINQSSDQPMMPSLPSSQDLKDLAETSHSMPVWHSPGSQNAPGLRVLEHSRPRLWGCSKARCCISDLRFPDHPIFRSPDQPINQSTDHPISRSPDFPISRSLDFRNVPRSYHTSITRQSNLKFSHQPRRLSSTEVGPTARERRSGAIPSCPPLTCRTEASSTRTMEFGFGFWFGFGFGFGVLIWVWVLVLVWVWVWVWVLPIATCQLLNACQLPLANC